MTWQPIETAPEDGTKILVFRPKFSYINKEDIFVVYYNNGNFFTIFTHVPMRKLTHWMPLPNPPEKTID